MNVWASWCSWTSCLITEHSLITVTADPNSPSLPLLPGVNWSSLRGRASIFLENKALLCMLRRVGKNKQMTVLTSLCLYVSAGINGGETDGASTLQAVRALFWIYTLQSCSSDRMLQSTEGEALVLPSSTFTWTLGATAATLRHISVCADGCLEQK